MFGSSTSTSKRMRPMRYLAAVAAATLTMMMIGSGTGLAATGTVSPVSRQIVNDLVRRLPMAGRSAAVGCFDGTCTGKDPEAMGCAADATTLEQLNVNGTIWELRHSAVCNADWGRIAVKAAPVEHRTTLDGVPPGGNPPPYTFIAYAFAYDQGFNHTWTPMGAARDNVRVCAYEAPVRGEGIWYCTKWYWRLRVTGAGDVLAR